MSECLCPLRLFIKQENCQELKSHLDKLMDHNDDVTDLEVSKAQKILYVYMTQMF